MLRQTLKFLRNFLAILCVLMIPVAWILPFLPAIACVIAAFWLADFQKKWELEDAFWRTRLGERLEKWGLRPKFWREKAAAELRIFREFVRRRREKRRLARARRRAGKRARRGPRRRFFWRKK